MASRGKKSNIGSSNPFDSIEDLFDLLSKLSNQQNSQPPLGVKPDHGIVLNRPRTVADIAASLHRLGIANVYRTNDQPIVIREIHSIKMEITTTAGETREVWLGLTDYHGPIKE